MQHVAEPAPLRGAQLALGAGILAMANFLAVLDTTIANVSVSNIAGSLGTSTSQGITFFRVAGSVHGGLMMNSPLPCIPKPSSAGLYTSMLTCSQLMPGRRLSFSGSSRDCMLWSFGYHTM